MKLEDENFSGKGKVWEEKKGDGERGKEKKRGGGSEKKERGRAVSLEE